MDLPNFKYALFNKRYVYFFGLLITVILTFLEFSRGRHDNFVVFSDASRDFWNGISPYTDEWVSNHGRFFLYTPIFSVLYSPFAFLPPWLGPFVWNIFNFTLFYLAIFTLPNLFTHQQKCYMFWFTLPILGQSLLAFQYNVTVAYIFLFSYSLMERKQYFWAILLIMLSGMTKIYGIFQLGLLLCYPQLWRNLVYTTAVGIVLFLSPLLKLEFSQLIPYYQEWLYSLSSHQSTQVFDSIYYAKPLLNLTLPYYRVIQLGVLAILSVLLLLNTKKYNDWRFRAQSLAVLMGWTILFSEAAEKHTYLIALSGYLLWYWSRQSHLSVDRILYWSTFILLCIFPIDIFVPKPVMHIVCYTLWLHVWIFLIIWVRMVWSTFGYRNTNGISN